MQRAGTVHSVAQGVAVVRSPDGDHPDIGAAVIDDNLDTVGRVVDVFGPVEGPFLVVTPSDDRPPAALLGTVLYYRPD